jgi:hydroxymethylglutaryl-CoA lyase
VGASALQVPGGNLRAQREVNASAGWAIAYRIPQSPLSVTLECVVVPRIEIVEVGPRDGLQNESGSFSTAVKVEFINRAVAAGLRRVEVASFVNPRKIPQMADAEAVLGALPRRPDVVYVGLVLNRRGFERARVAGCGEIGMVVAASDDFNERNQGATTEESVAAWLEIAEAAHAAKLPAQVTISVSFGCPFEGEIPPQRVVELAQRLAVGRPREIALADTIGVAVPSQVSDLVERVRAEVAVPVVRCHFHNTRNTGIANAYAAAAAGAQVLDASIGGIGGCPFAPAATGNIPTEDLVYMLNRMGVDTGISLEGLIDTSRWLQSQLGRTVPGMLVKAGGFPRPRATA